MAGLDKPDIWRYLWFPAGMVALALFIRITSELKEQGPDHFRRPAPSAFGTVSDAMGDDRDRRCSDLRVVSSCRCRVSDCGNSILARSQSLGRSPDSRVACRIGDLGAVAQECHPTGAPRRPSASRPGLRLFLSERSRFDRRGVLSDACDCLPAVHPTKSLASCGRCDGHGAHSFRWPVTDLSRGSLSE